MGTSGKLKSVKELERLIAHHRAAYYQGRAEISDESYDALEAELRALDPEHPLLALVGSAVDEGSEKVAHDRKMLSLEKTYDAQDVSKFLVDGELVSVFKIDGSSLSLIYADGHLQVAKTRGDGQTGENVTKKIAYVPGVPKALREKTRLEVRGELFCRAVGLHRISDEMAALGLERPSSQRNIVAGILSRKEHFSVATHLEFQAFDLIGEEHATELEKLRRLRELGFETPEAQLHRDKESLAAAIAQAKEFMATGDYLIDGLVFVYNQQALHRELGETSHHPRYKLAFKFQGETKTTAIESITWQVSRNGVLTPVAEVRPVELSGAMIGRVTLHNLGVVKDHNLKAGDEIEIVRSGEVIPKFLSVVKSNDGRSAVISQCPSCHTSLVEEEIRLRCVNSACPAMNAEAILHWIKQVNIEDLSDKRLQELINKGFVAEIPDLYNVSVGDLLTLEKTKEKLAQKIYDNIQKTKRLPLEVFLGGVGLEGASVTKLEKIVAHGFNTVEKVLALTAEELAAIDGFAEKSATELVESLAAKAPLIRKLLERGVEAFAETAVAGGALTGAKICITGALSRPRSEIEKLIKRHGGAPVGSVSKNTTYLLTNDTDPESSKYKKAIEVGTKVITEAQFYQLIGE